MMISSVQKSAPIVHWRLCFLTRFLIIIMFAILGVAGCASISPAPFTVLTTSTQRLREGADASLSLVYERTRDRYITEAATGDATKVDALLLKKPGGDTFGWVSSDPPLFFKVARFRDGVYRLNSTLIGYAGLLGQLASPDPVNSEKFEQLAKDLNGNLKNAVEVLGVSSPSNKEIAIFSTLGTAAFQAYLKNKQRSSLLKALNSNQPTIQKAAELCAYAVRITAGALRNEYNQRSTKLAALIANPNLSDSGKQTAIRDLVELDVNFIKEISVLRTLHQSYMALPAAHKELATGVADPKRGLPMVIELLENGHELNRLYEELSKDDKKKAAGVRS